MQVLDIKLNAVREGEQVAADVQVQRQKGDNWNVVRVETITSGTSEDTRKLILQDDERVIISGRISKIAVMDPNQNVVKMVDADPEIRAAQEAHEASQRRLNELRETKTNQLNEQKAEAIQKAEPKTNIGNPAPASTPKIGDHGQGASGTKPNQPPTPSTPPSGSATQAASQPAPSTQPPKQEDKKS
jgi:hypothetical protein